MLPKIEKRLDQRLGSDSIQHPQSYRVITALIEMGNLLERFTLDPHIHPGLTGDAIRLGYDA